MKTFMILCMLMITSLCYSQKPQRFIYNYEINKTETNPEWIEWKINKNPDWLQKQSEELQIQWIEYQKQKDTIAVASQDVKKDFKTYPVEYEFKMHAKKMRIGYAFEMGGLALFGTSLLLEWDNYFFPRPLIQVDVSRSFHVFLITNSG